MTAPAKEDVSDATKDVLGALSRGDPDLLAAGLEVRAEWQATSGLDDGEILRYLLQQHMRQSVRGLQERAAAWLGSR